MSLEGRDRRARFCSNACRAKTWKVETAYQSPRARNSRQGPFPRPENGNSRRGGERGFAALPADLDQRISHLKAAISSGGMCAVDARGELARCLAVRESVGAGDRG